MSGGDDSDFSEAGKFKKYIGWIKSLRCSVSTPFDPEDLVNCRSFAEVLHRIDEQCFPEEWVDKIPDYKRGTSWRLKANNLHKLLDRITEYLEKYATRTIKDRTVWKIDDQKFVEEHEHQDLNKVLCLVLGCSFIGRNKEEFIKLITAQSEQLQNFVMYSIQYIMENSDLASPREVKEDEISFIANGGGDHTNSQLMKEVDELKQDKERLENELEVIKQKLYEHTSNKTTEVLESENHELRKRKQELEERLLDMEVRMDSIKGTLESREEELESIRDKLNTIHAFEEDYRRMKDEVGELRNKEMELSRVTRELEGLKQRNKDASFEKSELNVLREKSSQYLKDMVDYEDEKARNKTLRQQLASLKAQKEEIEAEANKRTIRLNKLEADLAETKSKLASAEQKNDDLVAEKIEMQGMIGELKLSSNLETLAGVSNLGSELQSVKSMEFFSPNSNEKARLLFLEKEVTRLQEHVKELEGLQIEQREWQTSKDKNRELESKYQIAQEKIVELNAQVTNLESMLENPQANFDVNQLRVNLEQRSIEINTVKERADSFEKKLYKAEDDKKQIEEEKAKLQSLVDQRNEHLKKAKQLLTDQEHKLATSEDGGPTVHQMDVLKKELEIKQKLLRNLQEQIEKLNVSHEEEMRLVASSFHQFIMKSDSVQHNCSMDAGNITNHLFGIRRHPLLDS